MSESAKQTDTPSSNISREATQIDFFIAVILSVRKYVVDIDGLLGYNKTCEYELEKSAPTCNRG